MSPPGFEPAFLPSQPLQTRALDRAVTSIDQFQHKSYIPQSELKHITNYLQRSVNLLAAVQTGYTDCTNNCTATFTHILSALAFTCRKCRQ
jgi:hypothetical protein